MNWKVEYRQAALTAENVRRVPYYEFVNFQIQLGSAVVFALLKAYVWMSDAARATWRWYATRQTHHELRELNDQILKDIGISRSDIPAVSRMSAADPGFSFRDLPR